MDELLRDRVLRVIIEEHEVNTSMVARLAKTTYHKARNALEMLEDEKVIVPIMLPKATHTRKIWKLSDGAKIPLLCNNCKKNKAMFRHQDFEICGQCYCELPEEKRGRWKKI